MSKVPYIAVGNNELEGRPHVRAGDKIRCPQCGRVHALQDGMPPGVLLSYQCSGKTYLGAIDGRSVVGMTLSGGTLDLDEPADEPEHPTPSDDPGDVL